MLHPFVLQLNEGQTGGPVGVDINVLPVWRKGISGKGVVVSILDDGKQPLHVYHANNNILPSNVHSYNPDVKITSVDTNVIIVFLQVFPTLHVQHRCFKKRIK